MHRRKMLLQGILWWMLGGIILGISAANAQTVSIDLNREMAQTNDFSIEVVTSSAVTPKCFRVYIYHTHTYEAYEMEEVNQYIPTETWRTAEAEYNMVRVGAELSRHLRAAGIEVTHDTTAYEPPKLSSAYSRSLESLKMAL